MKTLLTWPPPYVLKKHPLAKSVKLRASPKHGLEITVPPRFNDKNILPILEKNKHWIMNQFAKLPLQEEVKLPELIHLQALEEKWQIVYLESTVRRWQIRQFHSQSLLMIGNITNTKHGLLELIKWLKKYAQTHLTTALKELSTSLHLHYTNITIRDQKTRWGSCSQNKSINLNYKLIFLPKHLVRYVMIHELCHTIHMNHSPRFWGMVSEFDPDWQKNRKALKNALHYIPIWTDA